MQEAGAFVKIDLDTTRRCDGAQAPQRSRDALILIPSRLSSEVTPDFCGATLKLVLFHGGFRRKLTRKQRIGREQPSVLVLIVLDSLYPVQPLRTCTSLASVQTDYPVCDMNNTDQRSPRGPTHLTAETTHRPRPRPRRREGF